MVTATGYSYIQPGIEDVVFMNLEFPRGVGANVHISWLDPLKVRRMTVVGSEKMVVYDDVSADAKITVYDKGVTGGCWPASRGVARRATRRSPSSSCCSGRATC